MIFAPITLSPGRQDYKSAPRTVKDQSEYPQDTDGKKTSSSFLYSCTRSLFEQAGFDYQRPKGKNHCVMRKVIDPR